jgi:hypothetical protein
LRLDERQQALLCVLLLRGDQTPGELKQRTERLQNFENLESLEEVLGEMIERDLVHRLERRPGEKQVRYRQLLGSDFETESEAAPLDLRSPVIEKLTAPLGNGLGAEIAELRASIQRLSEEVAQLRIRVDGEDDGPQQAD